MPARPGGPAPVDKDTTAGILFGIGAYGLWGLLPLYFFVLHPAGAVEIVANRVVWSLLFCVLLITVTRSWRVLAAAFRNRTVIGPLSIAAALIAVNWLTYTYGVTTGQAVEASLGYFINPLVSVLLGVFVLKEKLRPLQWAAVGIGFIAVGRADGLLRQAPLDRTDAGAELWPVRIRQEARRPAGGRDHEPHRGDDRAGAGGRGHHDLPRGQRGGNVWPPTVRDISGCWWRQASSPPCRCCSSAPPPAGCR